MVVAEAADGVQAVEPARTTRPDVVLRDARFKPAGVRVSTHSALDL
ncbi:hypothetical protein [Streptomyces azureus]|uniref:Two-component system response regulator n=1 Tax=Streptomyces azureus TaxID=146537 RepID=A0A0K8PCF2_STRAJ|nr:hypothetical protein [Streptomyces azureus]GAP45550.1 two-component system response regulator [Streptomyces azureus]